MPAKFSEDIPEKAIPYNIILMQMHFAARASNDEGTFEPDRVWQPLMPINPLTNKILPGSIGTARWASMGLGITLLVIGLIGIRGCQT